MSEGQPVHATTVAVRRCGVWQAVMILGPSGVGKSDLALRLIGRGWRLISDDTQVWASEGVVHASAPASIAGRIEVRGVGIVSAATRPLARVVLAVACMPEAVERLPEPQTRRFAGVDLPLLALDPRPASAVDVVASRWRRFESPKDGSMTRPLRSKEGGVRPPLPGGGMPGTVRGGMRVKSS